MPVDASIYNFTPYKFSTLADLADATAKRKETESLNAERQSLTSMRNATIEKQQREAARAEETQAAIQSALQKHSRPDGSLDQEGLLSDVRAMDFDAYDKLSKGFDAEHTRALAADKAERERDKAEGEWVAAQLRGTSERPELYPQVRAQIVSRVPHLASILGETPDPAIIEHIQQANLSNAEYLQTLTAAEKLSDGKEGKALARIYAANTPEQVASAFQMVDTLGLTKRLAEKGISKESYTPEMRQQALMSIPGVTPDQLVKLAAPEKPAAAPQGFTLSPGQKRYDAQGQEIASVAPRPAAPSGGGGGAAGPSDAKDIASAIMRGDQPPVMTGLYGKTAAVRGELARKGYDLTKATEDWNSTARYLTTLNGAQQVRLRQAVEFTKESLPTIRKLVTEWDSAGLPLLSSGTLESAANGAFGQAKQSLAVRLKGQIADLQSELGTVYKGGNSSTDESLKLAAENLKANWSKKAALDAIDQIERNLTIRSNSIKNTGVVGNENNAYAPKTGTAPAGTNKTAEELLQQYGKH